MEDQMKLFSSERYSSCFLSLDLDSGIDVAKAHDCWSLNFFFLNWALKEGPGQSKDPACVPGFPRVEEYLSLGFIVN